MLSAQSELTKKPNRKLAEELGIELEPEKKQKIYSIIREIDEKLTSIKRNIYEIGKLLYQAKIIIPHGQFQTWIENSFQKELPYSTAYAYMKIYETFNKNVKTVSLLPVNLLMEMTRKKFPDRIRELVNENVERFDEDDIKKFEKDYKSYKDNMIDQETMENRAKKIIDSIYDDEAQKSCTRVVKNFWNDVSGEIREIKKAASKVRAIAIRNEYFPEFHEDEKIKERLLSEIADTIRALRLVKVNIKQHKILEFDENSNN